MFDFKRAIVTRTTRTAMLSTCCVTKTTNKEMSIHKDKYPSDSFGVQELGIYWYLSISSFGFIWQIGYPWFSQGAVPRWSYRHSTSECWRMS
jgi:hypothetical protein